MYRETRDTPNNEGRDKTDKPQQDSITKRIPQRMKRVPVCQWLHNARQMITLSQNTQVTAWHQISTFNFGKPLGLHVPHGRPIIRHANPPSELVDNFRTKEC